MNPSRAALLFWISVVVCAIAELAIVAATARASRRSAAADATADATADAGPPLDLPKVDDARPLPRPRRWLELLYVVTPAIVLLLLFVHSWRALPPR